MRYPKILLLAALWCVTTTNAWTGETFTPNTLKLRAGEPSPPATLSDMAWYAGHWSGTGLGGFNEEIWSAPRGGAMMGMYRSIRNDAPAFYEFLMLIEKNGSVVLRLKHFNPDMKGWEERDATLELPLVAIRGGRIYFNGLTFERKGPDEVRIYLALETAANGPAREEEFHYVRKALIQP